MNIASTNNTFPYKREPDWLGENLIFLISQPRSGSTLLQRLLDGHGDIQTSAETWLMLHPVYGLRSAGIQTDYRADWASTGVREFLENYADGKGTYLSGVREFAQSIYGSVLRKNNKAYFLDKTPRYTMIVPDLFELFPKARYIFLIRNPLAVLNSELHTYIGQDYWKLAAYNPDLLDAPDRLVEGRKICGTQGITVHYEELVIDPEKSLRDICFHLKINFEDEMLEYGDRPPPRGKMNDPVGIHKHSKPAAEGLYKWKELGKNSQHRHFAISYLEQLGADTLDNLGYDFVELRNEIEKSSINRAIRPLYPWTLATKPRSQHRFRDRLSSTYRLAAQKSGALAGATAVFLLLAERMSGLIRRAFSLKPTEKIRQQSINHDNTYRKGGRVEK